MPEVDLFRRGPRRVEGLRPRPNLDVQTELAPKTEDVALEALDETLVAASRWAGVYEANQKNKEDKQVQGELTEAQAKAKAITQRYSHEVDQLTDEEIDTPQKGQTQAEDFMERYEQDISEVLKDKHPRTVEAFNRVLPQFTEGFRANMDISFDRRRDALLESRQMDSISIQVGSVEDPPVVDRNGVVLPDVEGLLQFNAAIRDIDASLATGIIRGEAVRNQIRDRSIMQMTDQILAEAYSFQGGYDRSVATSVLKGNLWKELESGAGNYSFPAQFKQEHRQRARAVILRDAKNRYGAQAMTELAALPEDTSDLDRAFSVKLEELVNKGDELSSDRSTYALAGMSQDTMDKIQTQIDELIIGVAGQKQMLVRGRGILTGVVPSYGPNDSASVEAVSLAVHEEVMPVLNDQSASWETKLGTIRTADTNAGFQDSQITHWLNVNMSSPNPEARLESSRIISNIAARNLSFVRSPYSNDSARRQEAQGAAISTANLSERAIKDAFTLARLGEFLPTAEANKAFLESSSDIDPTGLKAQYASEVAEGANKKALTNSLSEFWGYEAPAPGAMARDYELLVESSYVRNGGFLDIARSTAHTLLMQRWGQTQLGAVHDRENITIGEEGWAEGFANFVLDWDGEGRWMFMPPEKVLGDPQKRWVPDDWVRSLESATDINGDDWNGDPYNLITIYSPDQTKPDQHRWQVLDMSSGLPVTLFFPDRERSGGRVSYWAPNTRTSPGWRDAELEHADGTLDDMITKLYMQREPLQEGVFIDGDPENRELQDLDTKISALEKLRRKHRRDRSTLEQGEVKQEFERVQDKIDRRRMRRVTPLKREGRDIPDYTPEQIDQWRKTLESLGQDPDKISPIGSADRLTQ